MCVYVNHCPKSSATWLTASGIWLKSSANDLGGVGKKVYLCCKQMD